MTQQELLKEVEKYLGFVFEPAFDESYETILNDPMKHWCKSGKVFHADKIYHWVFLQSWKNDSITKYITNLPSTAPKHLQDGINKRLLELEEFELLATREKISQLIPTFKTDGELTPYMKAKGWPESLGCAGVFLADNTCVVPLKSVDGNIDGLQYIFPSGDKQLLEGSQKKGRFFNFGDLDDTTKIYICEGLTTAMSVYLATNSPSVCTFGASNMLLVAKLLARKYRSAKIIVVGDNDRQVEGNPGVTSAVRAANAIGASFIIPKFPEGLLDSLTDFNDLHVHAGLDKVKEQIDKVHLKHEFVLPLGFDSGNKHYFISSQNPQICGYDALSEIDLLNLQPVEYWMRHYGSVSRNGAQNISWLNVKSDLVKQSYERGKFEHRAVRGHGIWLDDGRVVVHLGNRLLVDGKFFELHALKSDFIYEFCNKVAPPTDAALEDCSLILECLSEFNFSSEDRMLLGGWIVCAQLCGILKWRPHLSLSGQAGTGKSTIGRDFAERLLEGYKVLSLKSSSTEAGLRQTLRSHALPVVFDEFEPDGQKSIARLEAVLELFRQTSSEGGGDIVKGSQSGTALQYSARFAGLVSAINPRIIREADISRFARINLMKRSTNNADRIVSLLGNITREYADSFFARNVKLARNLLKNIKTFHDSLTSLGRDQRYGQQYGSLLAGYYSLTSDGLATSAEALVLCRALVESKNENAESASTNEPEHEKCYTVLLESAINLTDDDGKNKKTNLRELLADQGENAWEEHKNIRLLQAHGIHPVRRDNTKGIIVLNNHPELGKLFRGTDWERSWNGSLKQFFHAKTNQQIWWNQKNHKGVFLPVSLEAPPEKVESDGKTAY